MRKVITEKHPFMKKVNKLYDMMEEMGILIEYGGNGGLNIVDTENDVIYKLRDLDSNEQGEMFPTGTEFKLTLDEF
jgi:hypothetical protein